MKWDNVSKPVRRKFSHLIVLYEELDILRKREQTEKVKGAIEILQQRCKVIRDELRVEK